MALNMKVEAMNKFHTFEIPTVIKHGIGAVKHVGEEVKKLGVSKALLVTDPGIYKAGVTNPVVVSLQEAGVEVAVFNKVEPNPPVRLVAEGSKLYAEENCDGLVAVGGGSSMDTAKAIGVEATHEGSVLDYEAAEGKSRLKTGFLRLQRSRRLPEPAQKLHNGRLSQMKSANLNSIRAAR